MVCARERVCPRFHRPSRATTFARTARIFHERVTFATAGRINPRARPESIKRMVTIERRYRAMLRRKKGLFFLIPGNFGAAGGGGGRRENIEENRRGT